MYIFCGQARLDVYCIFPLLVLAKWETEQKDSVYLLGMKLIPKIGLPLLSRPDARHLSEPLARRRQRENVLSANDPPSPQPDFDWKKSFLINE